MILTESNMKILHGEAGMCWERGEEKNKKKTALDEYFLTSTLVTLSLLIFALSVFAQTSTITVAWLHSKACESVLVCECEWENVFSDRQGVVVYGFNVDILSLVLHF